MKNILQSFKVLTTLVVLLVSSGQLAYSQDVVAGLKSAKDKVSGSTMSGVKIEIIQNGSVVASSTGGSGTKVNVKAEAKSYFIKFSKDGYYSKVFEIDFSDAPEEVIAEGYNFVIPLTLLPEAPDVNGDFFDDNPLATWYFDPMNYDMARSDNGKATKQLKNLEKDVREALEGDADKEKQYDLAMKNGQDAYNGENYQVAVDKFIEAMELYPDKEEASDWLIKAEEKLAEQQEAAEAEAQKKREYDNLVIAGDNLMRSKDYEAALQKYEDAQKIIDDSNIQTKVAQAKKAIEEGGQEEKFNQLIVDAEAAIALKEYDQAIQLANEAKAIDNTRPEPKEILNKVADAKDKDEKEANLAEFTEVMAEARRKFENDDLTQAKELAERAKTLNPTSSEPGTLLNDIAAIEREKENFNKLVKEGDGLFNDGKLEQAKIRYEEALKLLPNESHPKEQIGKINQTLLAQQEAGAAEEDYAKRMKEAGLLLSDESYEQAVSAYEGIINDFPDKGEPKNKLQEAKDGIAKKEEFKQLLADAETAFQNKEYGQAKKLYNEVLDTDPNNSTAISRLSEISTVLDNEADRKQKEAEYAMLIAKGQSQFTNEEYETALETYKEAERLMPSETESREKIDEINKILLERDGAARNQEKFEDLMNQGEKLFGLGLYEDAIKKFQEAAGLGVDDVTPQGWIDQANSQLDAQKGAEDKQKEFEGLMASGLKAYNAKDYQQAYDDFEKALNLQPDNISAKAKRNEAKQALDAMLATADKVERDKKFDELKQKGVTAFEVKAWQDAINYLTEALDLKFDAEAEEIRNKAKEYMNLDETKRNFIKQYNKRITIADKAFSDGDYEKAMENYSIAKNFADQYQFDGTEAEEGIKKTAAEMGKENIELAFQGEEVTETVNVDELFREQKQNEIFDARKKVENIREASEDTARAVFKENLETIPVTDEEMQTFEQSVLDQVADEREWDAIAQTETDKIKDITEEEALQIRGENDEEAFEAGLEMTQLNEDVLQTERSADDNDERLIEDADQMQQVQEEMEIDLSKEVAEIAVANSVDVEEFNESAVLLEKDQSVERNKNIIGADQDVQSFEQEVVDKKKEDNIDVIGVQKGVDKLNEGVTQRENIEEAKSKETITGADDLVLDTEERTIKQQGIEAQKVEEAQDDVEKMKDEVTFVEETEVKKGEQKLQNAGDQVETLKENIVEIEGKNDDQLDAASDYVTSKEESNVRKTERERKEGEAKMDGTTELVDDVEQKVAEGGQPEKPKNNLAEEYGDGVTQRQHVVKDDKGKIIKFITTRVVVIEGHGDTYQKIQTENGASFTKNGMPISEHQWQIATEDTKLERKGNGW